MDLVRLGLRLRQAREKLGLSQEALGKQVFKTQTAISEYESGERRISITDLPLFAQTLHVPILYFFEDNLGATDLDYLVLDTFHQLSDATKNNAIQVLQLLLEVDKRAKF